MIFNKAYCLVVDHDEFTLSKWNQLKILAGHSKARDQEAKRIIVKEDKEKRREGQQQGESKNALSCR